MQFNAGALLLALAVGQPLPPQPEHFFPSDPLATHEARQLMTHLGEIGSSPSFLFGHENTNYQGEHFEAALTCGGVGNASSSPGAPCNQSDVHTAVGRYPGLFGFNLAWVVGDNAKDIVPHAKYAGVAGAVLQLYWEAANPVTGGSANDLKGSPATEVLPGGSANAKWVGWMNRALQYIAAVNPPAVVLRLFHENTGGWFWWGSSATTPREYRALYNYTVWYFRTKGNLHSALYAYAPSKPSDNAEESYGADPAVTRYPGDSVVDVACFDRYDADWANVRIGANGNASGNTTSYASNLRADCDLVARFAAYRKKLFAICEFGVKGGMALAPASAMQNWWTDSFLVHVVNSASCSRTSWAMTWRNSAPDKYYLPLQGQPGFAAFQSFADSNSTIFA